MTRENNFFIGSVRHEHRRLKTSSTMLAGDLEKDETLEEIWNAVQAGNVLTSTQLF
jgi:hypothetical protein